MAQLYRRNLAAGQMEKFTWDDATWAG